MLGHTKEVYSPEISVHGLTPLRVLRIFHSCQVYLIVPDCHIRSCFYDFAGNQTCVWHATMPPIVYGDSFASINEFKARFREWAVEENFTPHILDSDIRVGCR